MLSARNALQVTTMVSVTIEDLDRMIAEQGGDWHEYVRVCSACSRVFMFHSIGSSCPDCDGTLKDLSNYANATGFEEEIYECPVCDDRFVRQDQFEGHVGSKSDHDRDHKLLANKSKRERSTEARIGFTGVRSV